MIGIDALLMLLDDLRAEAIGLVAAPLGRDAFAFGDVHGCLRTVEMMRERINDLVEQANRQDQ